jgi:hypothetical protein
MRSRGFVGELTIVAHGIKIQALKIRKKKGIELRVPCAITDIHGLGIVDRTPRRCEIRGVGHGGW